MNKAVVIQELNNFKHRGIDNWEGLICEGEVLQDGCLFTEEEAYAILKQKLKKEKLQDLVDAYLRQRKRIVLDLHNFYGKVLSDRNKRKAYVLLQAKTNKKPEREYDSSDYNVVTEGVVFEEMYTLIMKMITLYFHFDPTNTTLYISEYRD